MSFIDSRMVHGPDGKNINDKLNEQTTLLAEKASITDARLKSVKLSQSDMTEEFIQQIAGTTPVNSVPADKIVSYTKLADNAGDGLAKPFNLSDKSKLTTGGYIGASGAVVAGNYQYSDFIPVEVGKTYCWYGAFSISYQAAAYDINKNFIRNIFTSDLGGVYHAYTYNVPAGTYFIRFNLNNSGDLYTMVVEGTTYPSTYTSYTPVLLSTKLGLGIKNTLGSIGLVDKSVLSNMLGDNAGDGLANLYNLCDYSKITKDAYLGDGGAVVTSANYAYSDYIAVTVGKTYCWYGAFSVSQQLTTYDSNKTYLATVYASNLGGAYKAYTYTIPANVTYIRFNMGTTQLNTMVVEGTTYPTTYTEYGYKLLSNNLANGVKNSLNLGVLSTDINYNTAIGQLTLTDKKDTKYATAVGYGALQKNTTDGTNDAGLYNTAVGYMAMANNTIGNHNTALGWSAGLSLTTGTGNTALGQDAMLSEMTGVGNTAVGQRALQKSTNGQNNTAVGVSAMYWDVNTNVTGSDNTAIGHYAGSRTSSDTNLTFVGNFANKDSKDNSFSNSTAIGANAIISKSNQVRLGSSSVTTVDTYGDLECLTNGKGLILRSASGNKFKLTVSDAGALTITPVV